MQAVNLIQLPRPRLEGVTSLESVIAARRSVRRYTPQPLSNEALGQLLWAAQGITGGTPLKRAAPSAGAQHPLEFYVCRKDGIWRYLPEQHLLQIHTENDVRSALGRASWKQDFIGTAPCVFLTTAVYKRSTEQYGERGQTRYVPMDAGHAVQNLLLQAVALGLGAVCVAAFDDHLIKEIIELPVTEEPLYLTPVGYPA